LFPLASKGVVKNVSPREYEGVAATIVSPREYEGAAATIVSPREYEGAAATLPMAELPSAALPSPAALGANILTASGVPVRYSVFITILSLLKK
jgi:hypothetical protein